MTETPTPDDPGAIDLDLEEVESYWRQYGGLSPEVFQSLIAAVEALRERAAIDGLPCNCRFRTVEGAVRHGSETGELVDPDEPIQECALHKALRERVASCMEMNRRERELVDRFKGPAADAAHYLTRAEAAEARAAVLVEVLEMTAEHCAMMVHPNNEEKALAENIRATLATTPAQALERARAVEAKGYAAGLEAAAKCAEKHTRSYMTYPENWNRAIAKAIRALGKEGP